MRRRSALGVVGSGLFAIGTGCLDRLDQPLSDIDAPGRRPGNWELHSDPNSATDSIATHRAEAESLAFQAIDLDPCAATTLADTPLERALPAADPGYAIAARYFTRERAVMNQLTGDCEDMNPRVRTFIAGTAFAYAYLLALQLKSDIPFGASIEAVGVLPGRIAYVHLHLDAEKAPTAPTGRLLRVGAWDPPTGIIVGCDGTESQSDALFRSPTIDDP